MIRHEKLGYMRLQQHEAVGVSLEVLSIEPPSLAILQPVEKVKIKFRYTCANVAEAMIHVLGSFKGKDMPIRRSYGQSPISAQGETVEQEIALNESS